MKFGRPLSMKVAATSIRSGLPGLDLCNFSLKNNVKCCIAGSNTRAVRDNRPYRARCLSSSSLDILAPAERDPTECRTVNF